MVTLRNSPREKHAALLGHLPAAMARVLAPAMDTGLVHSLSLEVGDKVGDAGRIGIGTQQNSDMLRQVRSLRPPLS